jgi:amidophosphoribosyltransferase
MPDQDELIAATTSIEDIERHVDADSLAYLSVEGMLESTQIPKDAFCTACFTSNYPIPIPSEELRSKHVLEDSLPDSVIE